MNFLIIFLTKSKLSTCDFPENFSHSNDDQAKQAVRTVDSKSMETSSNQISREFD